MKNNFLYGNSKINSHSKQDGYNMKDTQMVKVPHWVNLFAGFSRRKPKTTISNALLQSNLQIEFEINSLGNLMETVFEFTIRENNTGASRFNVYDLFDRIEIEHDGKIFRTLYDAEIKIRQYLFQDINERKRKGPLEGVDGSMIALSPTIAQNTQKKLYAQVNIFEGTQIDLRQLKGDLIVRVYLNAAADVVVTGTSSDLTLVQFDLLMKQLSCGPKPSSEKKDYRDIHYVRNIETKALNASSNYDIKLTNFDKPSSYLLFFIRPTPLTNNNIPNFQQIEKFELLDSNNNIISSLTYEDQYARYYLSQMFDGHIFDVTNAYQYTYVIPFSVDPEATHSGSALGSMQFTGDEILRIYTPSGWSNGNYRIDIYSAEYRHVQVTSSGSLISSQ